MFCIRCGAKNPVEAAFCYNCGTALPRPAPTPNVPPHIPPYQPPSPNQNFYPTPVSPSVAYSPTNPTNPYGYAPPNYGPPVGTGAVVLEFHPLVEGAIGLPSDVREQPQLFYSYVNQANKLVFARRANFWTRVGAAMLDLVILAFPYFCIAGAIGTATTSGRSVPSSQSQDLGSLFDSNSSTTDPVAAAWILFLGMLLFFGYFFWTGLSSGQSVGKKVVKIRVIRFDGRKPDWLTALLRFLPGYMLSVNLLLIGLIVLLVGAVIRNSLVVGLLGVLAFGWGFWSVGWDDLKQGWHDKLARTLVVDTREYVEGVHFYFPSRQW